MKVNENVIAVCGPVDAGKSSLIGVLTSGCLDDGKGKARTNVLVHQHEKDSGRTSNITLNPLIYQEEKEGLYLNCIPNSIKKIRIPKKQIFEKNEYKNVYNQKKKIVSFIDLAGHEKYLKTTVYGCTGMFPDYGLLIIGANTGITRLTKEHLGILLYLKIPIIIIITKIDIAPPKVYNGLKQRLKKLFARTSFNKVLYFINNQNGIHDTEKYIDNLNGNQDIIPVISISNKNGTNINNLHSILFNLPNQKKWEDNLKGSVIYIDNEYNVSGVGLVLSGTIKGENVNVKQKMYLGPFNGEFKKVVIRSIHNNVRENVDTLGDKVIGCFNVKLLDNKDNLTRKMLKKGLVMLDNLDNWKDNICSTFVAKINILHHATTIKDGYTPVVHCGPIRQPAKLKIINNKKNNIRTGDNCIAEFTFIQHPEFIEKDMILFFRDGLTKGVGEVIKPGFYENK